VTVPLPTPEPGVVVVGVVGVVQSGAIVMVWACVAVRPVESTTFIVKL
jgi:hypothetical protein